MKKRAVERIPLKMKIKIFSGNKEYSGTMTNFSEKGMLINTEANIPIQTQIEIHVPVHDEVLKVLAEVKSFTKSDYVQNGIGVQLITPPHNYLKFIDKIKSGLEQT